MGDQAIKQAVLVQGELSIPHQAMEQLYLYVSTSEGLINLSNLLSFFENEFSSEPSFMFYETDTAIGTAAKFSDYNFPQEGTMVFLKFNNGNSAGNITVQFSEGDPFPVLLAGNPPSGAELSVGAGGLIPFFFDGQSLHQFGVYS